MTATGIAITSTFWRSPHEVDGLVVLALAIALGSSPAALHAQTTPPALEAQAAEPVDPNQSRLFFGPTGRSLGKGQVYLGVYEFVMPFVQVGVTDWLSIGGGTPLVFGFEEDGLDRPFWITPKLRVFNGKNTQVSAGLFQGFGGGAKPGLAYGVVTSGGPRASVTAALELPTTARRAYGHRHGWRGPSRSDAT